MSLWDLAGVALSVGASLYSNNQATKAAQSAANQAGQVSQSQYNQTRADYAPWLGVGQNALTSVAALNGVANPLISPAENQRVYETAVNNFQTTPGYQFRMNEGISALDRSAAARGRLLSGAQQKAVTKFGQDYASNEYNNYLNRLSSLAGLGQTATAQVSAFGQQNALNQGNAALNAGNARASGYTNQAGILNAGIQNFLTGI